MRNLILAAFAVSMLFVGGLLAKPGAFAEVLVEGLDGVKRALQIEELSVSKMDAQTARIRFPKAGAATELEGFELHMISGDRVRGQLVAGSESELTVLLSGHAKVGFGIEQIRVVRATDVLGEARLIAPENGDRLWRRVGTEYDRIDGLLIGFNGTGLSFEGQLGERLYPWEEVAALWIEPLGDEAPAATSDQVAVDLVDGSRLRGAFRGISEGELHLETATGGEVSLPFEVLLEVNVDNSSLRFVSELAFERVGEPGLFGDGFGLQLEPHRDRSVLGGPLMCNGQKYGRGLGVHAPSHVAVDWASGGTLRGSIGVDDSVRETAAVGSAIFEILLDGESAYRSPELSSVGAPLELPALDLEGVKRIEFVVDEASNSVMGDRANWLDLRITKGS